MAAPAGTLLDKLARLQSENRIGRMTPGLGPNAAGWLRRTGAGTRPVSPSFAVDAATAIQVNTALLRTDIMRERSVSVSAQRVTAIEAATARALRIAMEAKSKADQAQRTARQAFGGSVGSSAVDRIRQKRLGIGQAMKIGRGITNPVGGMRMALRGALGPAFAYSMVPHVVGGAMNQAVDIGLELRRMRAQTASPSEFRRLAGNMLAGQVFEAAGIRSLASGINRVSAATSGGDVEQAERDFDRRWREIFTSREEAARMGIARRAEIARLKAESEKKIAEVGSFLRDYTPKTFTVATINDREVYRRELVGTNVQASRDAVRAIKDGVAKAIREVP